jgi:glucose/arabinose dehydrogenase
VADHLAISGGARSRVLGRPDDAGGAQARTRPHGRIAGQTALRVGARVRDVREGPGGAIWALTGESNGRLFRFESAG